LRDARLDPSWPRVRRRRPDLLDDVCRPPAAVFLPLLELVVEPALTQLAQAALPVIVIVTAVARDHRQHLARDLAANAERAHQLAHAMPHVLRFDRRHDLLVVLALEGREERLLVGVVLGADRPKVLNVVRTAPAEWHSVVDNELDPVLGDRLAAHLASASGHRESKRTVARMDIPLRRLGLHP